MAQVIAQRMTADVDSEVIVFLIGMRINQLLEDPQMAAGGAGDAAHAARACRPTRHPVSSAANRGAGIRRSWCSTGDRSTISSVLPRTRRAAHRPAWAAFNRAIGEQRRRRHLARDLPRPAGRHGIDLQQHAAVRPGPRDAAGAGAGASRVRARPDGAHGASGHREDAGESDVRSGCAAGWGVIARN